MQIKYAYIEIHMHEKYMYIDNIMCMNTYILYIVFTYILCTNILYISIYIHTHIGN